MIHLPRVKSMAASCIHSRYSLIITRFRATLSTLILAPVIDCPLSFFTTIQNLLLTPPHYLGGQDSAWRRSQLEKALGSGRGGYTELVSAHRNSKDMDLLTNDTSEIGHVVFRVILGLKFQTGRMPFDSPMEFILLESLCTCWNFRSQ